MLKYKILRKHGTDITWDVHIFMKPNATVGNFVQEIKESHLDNKAEKTIFIYRKGIAVGGAVFKGDEPIAWSGAASEIWGATVERCEMTSYNPYDYRYSIYIKEPREGAYVRIAPWFPKLIDAVTAPIPAGGYA